ncbi:hypothetical protein AB4120_18220 [Cupriavidus sp. 2KB_3]|uniref:hypothetical protein n=1 Tax=Cupriavidus TaxID=106589 RepID=UPI0011F05025|nr:hypothetical protein [Cupriavidus campinensis]
MRKLARYLLLAVWLLTATLGLTYFWIHWLARFIYFPDAFWMWLFANIPGFWDGESAYDLEVLIYMAASFVVVSIGTLLAYRFARIRR